MRRSYYSPGDRKQVNFYYSKSKHDKFLSRFPHMNTYFLQVCLDRAISESDFVSHVLCGDKFNSSADFSADSSAVLY